MESADVKRFGLILAIQAEIDGMKVANAERDLPSEAATYNDEDFQEKAEELRNIAQCHNEQL